MGYSVGGCVLMTEAPMGTCLHIYKLFLTNWHPHIILIIDSLHFVTGPEIVLFAIYICAYHPQLYFFENRIVVLFYLTYTFE